MVIYGILYGGMHPIVKYNIENEKSTAATLRLFLLLLFIYFYLGKLVLHIKIFHKL